ncbi:MAG: hypothetical protein U0325_02365 [Polyangiales bacterium]
MSSATEIERTPPRWLRGGGFFVTWYGDPETAPAEAQRVRAARPDFVIVGAGLHARASVPALFLAGGVRAVAYLAVAWGRRPVQEVAREIDEALRAGYAGVFLDQADPAADAFNRACADAVRAVRDTLLVMNTGRADASAALLALADIVCVENQWDRPLVPSDVPPWRWMSVQGDPARDAPATLAEALGRRAVFRGRGGGWYYAGPWAPEGSTHWRLAPWLEAFAAAVRADGPLVP